MPLLVLIILATIAYALYEVFAAKAGGRINANLSAVIVNGLGVLLPLAVLAITRATSKDPEQTHSDGIVFSLLAGVAIAVFSVLFVKIFAKGGDASYVVPVIYGGAIVITSVVGLVLWKEAFTALQLAGLAAIIIGVIMITVSKIQ